MADPELQGLIEYREVTLWSTTDDRCCQICYHREALAGFTVDLLLLPSSCLAACGCFVKPVPVLGAASQHHSLPPICLPALLASTCFP